MSHAPTCPYCGRELVDAADVEREHCGLCVEFYRRLCAMRLKARTLSPYDALELGLRLGREILERHRERLV